MRALENINFFKLILFFYKTPTSLRVYEKYIMQKKPYKFSFWLLSNHAHQELNKNSEENEKGM